MATIINEGVVVTSGRRFSVLVRHELFDRICGGLPLRTAAQDLGVSKTIATSWWQQAGGMRLTWGSAAAGLKEPGDASPRSIAAYALHRIRYRSNLDGLCAVAKAVVLRHGGSMAAMLRVRPIYMLFLPRQGQH
jgi:hypothetical protein